MMLLRTTTQRVAPIALGVSVLLAMAPAAGAMASESPIPHDESATPLRASEGRHGLRLTIKFDGPLRAGEPTRVLTRLTNNSKEPRWWDGPPSLSIGAVMLNDTWRLGEEISDSSSRLKAAFGGECQPMCDRVVLAFEPVRVNGEAVDDRGGGVFVPTKLKPGASVTFVHEWDGLARFDRDTPAVGIPPGGPVEVIARAYYRTTPNVRAKALVARARTVITDGRDDGLLHPFEVVDAAQQDPGFTAAVADANYVIDNPYLAFDDGLWYVGTCRLVDEPTWRWNLGVVDPVSGEVLELLGGESRDACRPDSRPSSFTAMSTVGAASVPEGSGE